MKTNIFVSLTKYIITILSVSIICFGEQIYISETVIVEDFVGSGFVGDVDGAGIQTMLTPTEEGCYSLIKDEYGNFLFLNGYRDNKYIKKIDKNGIITRVSSAKDIKLITADGKGNIYLLSDSKQQVLITRDFVNYKIQNIEPKLTAEYTRGISVDSSGNIYLSNAWDRKIYQININGVQNVFAGSGNSGNTDGIGIFSSFYLPTQILIDFNNDLVVNDLSVRKIDPVRSVKTITENTFNELDGIRGKSNPRSILAMAADSFGNIIISSGNSIRIIDKTGGIKTIAGSYNSKGYKNGQGKESRFENIVDIVSIGNTIYVAESLFPRIRKITIGEGSSRKPFDKIDIKLSAGITINGTVGKKYSIESSSNGGKQWTGLTELELSKTPFTWYDENSVGTNNLYRVFETP